MIASKKFVCIHGHFYQPPRENAWLEVVESQDSASPFHDWNDRINFECYAPNTAARILDYNNRIVQIVNNYSHISFNFGPTLLSWMEKADPETYAAIQQADRISSVRFGGHGAALAQVYNHMIMPLANSRDKETQVRWGLRDFEHRFQRTAEGMWLAETAVDDETLEILAEHGINFTLLAPRQAKAIRPLGGRKWTNVSDSRIDPTQPYLYRLPSGRSIVLFFYDGHVAQGVAFEGLLNNGQAFADRILGTLSDDDRPQLAHIATDGESYGHHHRYGEMALASCLKHIEDSSQASLTNYGEYLENFPPEFEVQIHQDSSWSCVHGVERWRRNCGCNSGGRPDWNQEWRAPLRETLDWLRDELNTFYEKETEGFFEDPWQVRDRFIECILDREEENQKQFIQEFAGRSLTDEQRTHLLRLLEMQRNAMLMYTSCGWFFDEVSGIETNQILQYAYRAIDFAWKVRGVDLKSEFLDRLEKVPSNVLPNAAESLRLYVQPKHVDLERVGMHYAVSSLFEDYPDECRFFNYWAYTRSFQRLKAGHQRLTIGRSVVKSVLTHSEKEFSFAVLYLGQQNLIGNIRTDMSEDEFEAMKGDLIPAFHSTNLGEVIGIMQNYFGSEKYSIRHLFKDERQKILQDIARKSLRRAELAFREIYNETYQLMTDMSKEGIPIPAVYLSTVEHIINQELLNQFSGDLDLKELQYLASERDKWGIRLQDEPTLQLAGSEHFFREIRTMETHPSEQQPERIRYLIDLLEETRKMGLELDLWKSQNFFFYLMLRFRNGELEFPDTSWRELFLALGGAIGVNTESIELSEAAS